MKKLLIVGSLLLLAWVGWAYFGAAWNRVQFEQEVDSLLQSPRDLTEENLPPLILNKAGQFGITLDPDEIEVRIESADRETTTSRLLEGKGLAAQTRILRLRIRYSQAFLGTPKQYTLDRERTFTSSVAPSTSSDVSSEE